MEREKQRKQQQQQCDDDEEENEESGSTRMRPRNALSSSCSLDKNYYSKINLINEPINLYQRVIDILMIKREHG